MVRGALFAVFFFLICVPKIQAQDVYNTPPDYYSVPMKRMLAKAVGTFIYQIAQGQLDADSAMSMACKIYNINRLLPYNEGFDGDQSTRGMILINSRKIDQAIKELPSLKGDDKLRRYLELVCYYLFKPGSVKSDLDNTKIYLDRIAATAGSEGSFKWKDQYDNLYGQYYATIGDKQKSKQYFEEEIKSCKKRNDKSALAAALVIKAKYLPFNSPEKLKILSESQSIYKKLDNKIGEFNALSEIFAIHFTLGNPIAFDDVLRIVKIEKALGFRHLQYVYNVITYMYSRKGNYATDLDYARLSLKYMEDTGDKVLATLFYQRMGNVIMQSGVSKSIEWHKKSFSIYRTRETQVFWYKGFLQYAADLEALKRTKEALSLIKSITKYYPPTNKFDQMFVYTLTGFCQASLGKNDEAEEQFKLFTGLAAQFPAEFIHDEFPTAYFNIASFYIGLKKYKQARIFIDRAVSSPYGQQSLINLARRAEMSFTLDSAAGNYISAIKEFRNFKMLNDSMLSLKQRQKYDELEVRFESVNKDKNIKLLKQNNEMQSTKLKEDVFFRNMVLGAVLLASIISGLLYYLYRLKQRSNIELQGQQKVLQRLINEKEWLVKEIHHRVKNNLHTIVSLLESQSAFLNNDDALTAVRDSQHRVHAMSLIHQKLYMGNNMQTINSVDYIKELLSYLILSFKLEGNIIFETEIQSIDLDVALAIPLGLIINEAVTNSIKYAFDKPGGSVKISLAESGEAYQLKILDDGIGLPKNFNINERISSLGMTLMKGLSKEIGAEFTITSDKGTSIIIVFPLYKFTD
jgi:two-component sensor histidine kinase